MKRAKRLEPVREIAREAERSCAARVSGMERRLAEAEHRYQELLRYQQEYQQSFRDRAGSGLDVRSLREYQTFLARLAGAIESQRAVLQQLRDDCDRERGQLREAIARRLALSKVIEKANIEERVMDDRRMQRELDERAQRPRLVQP